MNHTLLRAICEAFALGEPLAPPHAVPGGLSNRLWRLETDRGVFAVKEMARVEPAARGNEAFALERAAYAAGIAMPRPVPVAATGDCFADLPAGDGTTAKLRVHEWVEGAKLENGVVYPDRDLARVAAVHARLHALDMRTDATSRDALRVFGNDHWRAIADRAERSGAAWADDLRALLPALDELEQYVIAAHDDTTPLLVSHRDSDQKNFMRTPIDELLLVDWDGAGAVNPRHDLANHALVWAGVHRDEPDPHAVRAFVAAYREAGGTSERFRPTDLAELVARRLAWIDFNLHRALGEQLRDERDAAAGVGVLRRNTRELPRILRSLERWIALLNS